jgi:pimeloyl-ACP methyl ester carboxylesterase
MPRLRPLHQLPIAALVGALLAPALVAQANPAARRGSRAPAPATRPDGARHDSAFRVRVVGTGRPILLVPGLMSAGDVWNGTVAHLQRQFPGRYQLHVVTLAGFAGVPAVPTDDFLGRATEALLAYARRVHATSARHARPLIVGHSLGAVVAYRMAIAAPELVGGVVAVDGVPFYPALMDTAATVERARPPAAAMRAAFAGRSPTQVAQQVRGGLALQMRDTTHHGQLLRWAEASDPPTVGQAMAEVLTTDLRPQLGAVRAPVLQVAAVGAFPTPELRAMVARRYAAQLVRLPSSELAVAERAHHFVMLDDPAFLHAALDRFLAQIEAAAPAVGGRR